METYSILNFSPSEVRSAVAASPFFSFSKHAVSTTESGSPAKRLKMKHKEEMSPEAQFEANLHEPSHELHQSLASSKRIELPFSLVKSGRAIPPPDGDYSALLRLLPTTFAVEVFPPCLIIRVRQLPPKPWPFTIGGLPVQITKKEHGEVFQRGKIGRGNVTLSSLDLLGATEFSNDVLKAAIDYFKEIKIKIKDIFWFAGFWLSTTISVIDLKLLPPRIAGSPVWYRPATENPNPDPAAPGLKTPHGVDYDDSDYVITADAILRPGIMISSSAQVITTDGRSEDCWRTTTSGILVADRVGELFITVASHGFEDDGLVYHPNPKTGKVIEKVVASLPHTGISLVKLNPGLRYINDTFGNSTQPEGVIINGIAATYQPHMRSYDTFNMNNPFSGYCVGTMLATGARITGESNKKYILHDMYTFENGEEAVDGSCGSPVLDEQGRVAGLFRFKQKDSAECLCIAAIELREFGYEICEGLHKF